MLRKYKKDILFLTISPIVAAIVVLASGANLLVSTILFFGPQAAYFSLRRNDIVGRLVVYSTAVSTISILSDYLAERDNSWTSSSMFGFRILDVVPIEALVWMFLFVYVIIGYFLYFFEKTRHRTIGKRLPLVLCAAGSVVVWAILASIFDLQFRVEYFYIKFGLMTLLFPLIVFMALYPRYIRVFINMAPYFVFLGLVNLIVSLHAGHWSYPGGNFVGWIEISSYRFPVEELVFWILLFPSFLVSQFEMFNNDKFKFSDTHKYFKK
jgi:hypothetical protein